MPDIVSRLRRAGCVFAEDEARLLRDAARTPRELQTLVSRRVAGEPLEYLLGWVEFCGLRIPIAPGVFVPRRRTEFLAREAGAALRPGDPFVDLCCGSGAVAIAVRAAVPGVEVHAVDVDPVAVACARRSLGERVHEGELYEPLPAGLRGRVAVITANAPYVPTEALATMPVEARLHEPLIALDGGPDGLAVLRRVVAGAPGWLRPGGRLLVECSRAQAPRLAEAVTAAGLTAKVLRFADGAATIVRGLSRAAGRENAAKR